MHFGESELNFRTGERFKILKLSRNIVTYSNQQLKQWNSRGIETLDRSIQTIKEFIDSGILDKEPVAEKEFRDFRLRVAELLAASQLKTSDVEKIINAFDDVVQKAAKSGELGVITFMRDKLVELKKIRLSTTRGTEENVPIWKIIGILILFGFPIYKSLRCIRKGKCCNTVSGLEGLIQWIAVLAIYLD